MLYFLIYFLLTVDYSKKSFAENLTVVNDTTIELSVNRTTQSIPIVNVTTVKSAKQSNDSLDINVVPEQSNLDVSHNFSSNTGNVSKSNTEHQNESLASPNAKTTDLNSSLNVSSFILSNESTSAGVKNHSFSFQRGLQMSKLLTNSSEKDPKTIFVPSKYDSFENVDVDLIPHNDPLSGRSFDVGQQRVEIDDQIESRKIDDRWPVEMQIPLDVGLMESMMNVENTSYGRKINARGKPKTDGSLEVDIDLVPLLEKISQESKDVKPDVKPRMPTLVNAKSKAAVDLEIDLVNAGSKPTKVYQQNLSKVVSKNIVNLDNELKEQTTHFEENVNTGFDFSYKAKANNKPPVIQLDVDILASQANDSVSKNNSILIKSPQKEGVINLDIDLVEVKKSGVTLPYKVHPTTSHLVSPKMPIGRKAPREQVNRNFGRKGTQEKTEHVLDVDIDLIAVNSNLSSGALNITLGKKDSLKPSVIELNLDLVDTKQKLTPKPQLRAITPESKPKFEIKKKPSVADAFIDVDIDLIPVEEGKDVQYLKGQKLPTQLLMSKEGATGTIEVELDLVVGGTKNDTKEFRNIYTQPQKSGSMDIDIDLVPGKGSKGPKVQISTPSRSGQRKHDKKAKSKVSVDVDLVGIARNIGNFQQNFGSKDPYVEVDIDFVGDNKVLLDTEGQSRSQVGLPSGSKKNFDVAVEVDIEFVPGDNELKLGPPVTGKAVFIVDTSTTQKPITSQGPPQLRAMKVPPTDGPYIEVDIEFVANNNSLIKTLKTYKGPNGEEMIELPPGFKIKESAVELDIEFIGNNISGRIEPQTFAIDASKTEASGRSNKLFKPVKETENLNAYHSLSTPVAVESGKQEKPKGSIEIDIDFVTNKKIFNISGLIGGAGGPVIEIPQNLKGVSNPEVEVDIELVGDKNKLKGAIVPAEEPAVPFSGDQSEVQDLIISTERPASKENVMAEEEKKYNELSGENEAISDSKNLEPPVVDIVEQPSQKESSKSPSGRQISEQSKDTDIKTSEESITNDESTDADSEEERSTPVLVYTAKQRKLKHGTTAKTVNKFPIPPHMKPSLPAAGRRKSDSAGQDDSKASSKGGVSIWVWGTIVAVVAMSLMVIAALSYSPIRQKTQDAT